MLVPGTLAPPFELPDQHGNLVRSADLRGKWVLMWWYPKAQTPGCTIEGQGLRDLADEFAAAGCVILGASFDTQAENLEFDQRQGFGFPLLSDTEHSTGIAYEVVRRGDEHYGGFAERYSYLIDPDGIVRRAYGVSDVDNHAAEVLDDLRALTATDG